MNIGIIVHSQKGNTHRFATLIQTALTAKGHNVSLTRLLTDKEVKPGPPLPQDDFTVTNVPDVSQYDLLMLGCPVWAFGATNILMKAISLLPSLTGKRVLPFTTMGFPLPGMGGKRTLRLISQAAAAKGATLLPGSIVCQMLHNFYADMEKEANRLAATL